MRELNVFMSGVGGQGIGLFADVLTRACMAAGLRVLGADTHGLAQRGGIVVSHLRLGDLPCTPRVPPGEAHIVVGLERLEALRGAETMLAPGGTVLFYDSVYQPIHVRMGLAAYPSVGELEASVAARGGRLERVRVDDLPDPMMQNVALLGAFASLRIIGDLTPDIVEGTLASVVPARALDANLRVFRDALTR
jgi:indolepyruvate ferredoxin oxidoreductase, beta subunit